MHARDERIHDDDPDVGPGWCEAFDLEFASPRGTFGGHITVVRWPVVRRVWYWTAVVSEDGAGSADVVSLLETEIPLKPTLELRWSGIWADQNCESPFEHWSYGLEAFALRLDHPDEALGAYRGERTPLGYDLEWEARTDPETDAHGYGQGGRVHGEVVVGDVSYELDGSGRRRHVWGEGASPVRSGTRLAGVAGWIDAELDRVTGCSVAELPAPAQLVVRRLLGRSAAGAVGWANLVSAGPTADGSASSP